MDEGAGRDGKRWESRKREGEARREEEREGGRERRAGRRIKESLHVCGTSSSQHFHII